MSYDIDLLGKNGEIVKVETHSEGGTHVFGGTTAASLNVTWNYAQFFDTIDKKQGIRWLYGKKASECVQRLREAIGILGTDQDEDYWTATQGNAGHALEILLKWAEQHPDAEFRGD